MVTPSPSSPFDFLRGWVFAVPLIGILLFHESGHYLMARRHKVAVSPPYFIPFPNLIGTMGAFISIRSPIKSRKVLLDIGAAGPLAGLLPSMIALALGYHYSTTGPMVTDTLVIEFGDSILSWTLQYLVIGSVPDGLSVWIHPAGLAGWVGLFVTMLNLLPIGQLDGGHIAYALIGRRQWVVAPLLLVALIVLGYAASNWWWWLLGFLVVLYLVTIVTVRLIYRIKVPLSGLWKGDLIRHPHIADEEELDPRRRLIGWICVAVFILCFIPVPIKFLNLPAG
jgi:membrane-associated protease RseP (regulator of RpoE activity)